MTDKIKLFLDNMFKESEEIRPMTMMESAANIQYWREDGVEVPEGLTSVTLCAYIMERVEEAKKAEKPLRLYRILVEEKLTTEYIVEAHDADEADAIFQAWEEDPDNCCGIRDDLVMSSEGWEADPASEWTGCGDADIKWEEGEKLL